MFWAETDSNLETEPGLGCNALMCTSHLMQIWSRYTDGGGEMWTQLVLVCFDENEKLTLSMSYVGVRFLVGSVESSGSAEEEGEG